MMWVWLFVIVQPLICACSNDAAASANQGEFVPPTSYYCPVVECAKVYTNFNSLRSHVQRKHPDSKRYKCEMCEPYSSEYRNILIDHIVSEHGMEAALEYCARYESEAQEFKCPEEGCLHTFDSKAGLQIHEGEVHASKRYKCDTCFYNTERQNHLIKHIQLKHGPEAAKYYLDTHKSEAKRFECPEVGCFMTFPSKQKANVHRSTHSTKPQSQLGLNRNIDLQTATHERSAETISPTSHTAHYKRNRRQDDADETLASTQDDVQSTSSFQPHPLHQPSEGRQRKPSNPRRVVSVEPTTSAQLPHPAIQQLQSGEVQSTSSIARNPLDDAIQHHSRKTSNPQRWRRRGETTSPLQLSHSPIEQTQGDEGNGDHEDTDMMTGETETRYLDTSGSVQLVPGDMAIGHSEQSSREINEMREESQTVPVVSSQGLASMPPEARSKPLYKASSPHSFPHP